MISFFKGPLTAVALLGGACDRAPSPVATKVDAPKASQTGAASFYGSELEGRKTASGERLELDAMTGASRTVPLGTHVKVTNMETGRSATVKINDRGPYAEKRVLDLTPTAARHIGIDQKDGVAQVSVTPIPPRDLPATDR